MKTSILKFIPVLLFLLLFTLSACNRNPEQNSHYPPQEPDSEYPGSKLYDSIHGDTMENRGNHH